MIQTKELGKTNWTLSEPGANNQDALCKYHESLKKTHTVYLIAMLSLIRFQVTYVQFCLFFHAFLNMMCTLIDIRYGTKKLHLFETSVGGWFFTWTMPRQRLDSPGCSCHLSLVFQPPVGQSSNCHVQVELI